MLQKYKISSESVCQGHPDKLCDAVSDTVLDAYLAQDPEARVACETMATNGLLVIAGEVSSEASVDIEALARRAAAEAGYTDSRFGFSAESCAVLHAVVKQSEDIDAGVSRSLEEKQTEGNCGLCYSCQESDPSMKNGAGDQGMMYGYACRETASLMPAPIVFAHRLCRRLDTVRREGLLPYLGPDGKAMVTVSYEGGKPEHIDTVVVSAQHLPDVERETIQKDIEVQVVKASMPPELMREDTRILGNPTGRLVKGGPDADTGLTGGKIIVDTYGGIGRHGGGAFSGKDPTKVDRAGAYAARYVAKNIVAAGLAERCEVQISYAIGVARPVAVYVDDFGTSRHTASELSRLASELFDLRPTAIIEAFGLRRPIYRKLSAYGHFGREDLDAAWEKTDRIKDIQSYFGSSGI